MINAWLALGQGRSYGFLVHSGGELVVAAALPGLNLKRWVAM